MEIITIVKIPGFILGVIGIVLVIQIITQKNSQPGKMKRMIPLALIAVPLILMFLANYHVFEGNKKVSSCNSCHVMSPLVNDMENPESMTLAARHFKNNWIPKDQCYGCHKDYGFSGNLKAKGDGYRHLMRYTTGTYTEPIRIKGEFNNQNCLNCHEGTEIFNNVNFHDGLVDDFKSNETSCLNCHGRAHPTPLQRISGSEDYKKLTEQLN